MSPKTIMCNCCLTPFLYSFTHDCTYTLFLYGHSTWQQSFHNPSLTPSHSFIFQTHHIQVHVCSFSPLIATWQMQTHLFLFCSDVKAAHSHLTTYTSFTVYRYTHILYHYPRFLDTTQCTNVTDSVHKTFFPSVPATHIPHNLLLSTFLISYPPICLLSFSLCPIYLLFPLFSIFHSSFLHASHISFTFTQPAAFPHLRIQ